MKKLLLFVLLLAGFILTGCEFNQPAEDEQVDELMLVPKQQTTGEKAKTASNQQTSPYSCLISTLADDEADYNYWNQAFWVHFPKPAIEQAEGNTIFKAFSFASEHAGEKAGSWAGKDRIVRVAQCEIPDSKLAETLLEEQLRKFGKGTWLESHKANQERSSQNEVQAKSASDWDWDCSEYFITVVCQVDSQSGDLTNCVITDIRCISYELVYNGSGGGGGGGGFPGDDPGDCDPMGTEPCFEDGGGGSIPPPEPDPCDEPNPPAWCQPGNKCETGDATIDNTGVQETFEDQWGKSNADATDQNDRLEQGGWITEDPISGELGFTEFPSEWTRQPCRIQLPESITVPNNTVGILHTHPFQLGEKMYSCANLSQTMYQQFQQQFGSVVKTYEGNPSPGDVSLIEQINDASPQPIKAYLIDEDGITEYDENSDPNDINTSNRHERCGF